MPTDMKRIFSPSVWSGKKFSRKVFEEMKTLASEIEKTRMKTINFMEVCGTHTMAIAASGIRSMLPKNIRMLSGPGCPVCVTSQGDIDRILEISRIKDVVMTTFGDMMKVKGSGGESLYDIRKERGRVEVVYSPLDALKISEKEKGKNVVFAGVGFETTAPLIAQTVIIARERKVENFYVAPLFKLVPPALKLVLSDKTNKISGFILPGHVSVILGSNAYSFLQKDFKVPSVIAGFEPMDIVRAINLLLYQIKEERAEVEVEYTRAVRPNGNKTALRAMNEVFKPASAYWRAVGEIPNSGLAFTERFGRFDAFRKFGVKRKSVSEPKGCICGKIIMGKALPGECKLFGKRCTPSDAVGPCMVSSEGACAAWFKYGAGNIP